MNKIINVTAVLMLLLVICTGWASFAAADDLEQIMADKNHVFRSQTQNDIDALFQKIGQLGGSYNSGGSKAASKVALGLGCEASFQRLMQMQLFDDWKHAAIDQLPDVPDKVLAYAGSSLASAQQSSWSTLCAALQGESSSSGNVLGSTLRQAKSDISLMALEVATAKAKSFHLPFLTNIEITSGTNDRQLFGSVTSIQPLWSDKDDRHHVFAQTSWYKTEQDKNRNGFNKVYDTLNLGFVYRHLSLDKLNLWGANLFFDHTPKLNHNRMSIGVDARTSQLFFAANRYMPLSGWRKLDDFYEEKAAAGWDILLRGQLPELPSWSASVKGYEWDNQDNGANLYGAVGTLDYSPVPALTMSMGLRDDSQNKPSLEAALRFNIRFDQPQDLQWRERTALLPVSDYVYAKAERENIIRVQQQRRAESKLTVIQSIGANISNEESGTRALFVGQSLLMPVTVTVANSVGAIGRLMLSDGSVLTLGQNSQVRVEPKLITLLFGTVQYVSNGIIQTIVVPGGTITLHGTDIDIVSNGTDTSVRVRDGAVDFVGQVSGASSLSATQAAQSIAGVIGTIATGSAAYITHTDDVSTKIDRIANIQNGNKVTPYPYERPYIVSSNMVVGGQLVLGLKFSDAVTVTGGTPRLLFTINGNARSANYIAGSGSSELQFSYTLTAIDIAATSLTVTSFDNNGADITGNGKQAVTTIADALLPITGGGIDVIPPSGYGVAFTTAPINDANKMAAAFNITTAEIGSTYSYSITSSGGGAAVTGTGTISSATQVISALNVSGLADGTLTVSVILTDTNSNAGAAVTGTVTKDIVAPTILSVTPPANGVYAP